MKRCLVSGGCGYVGCVAVDALLRAGYEVVVFDKGIFPHGVRYMQALAERSDHLTLRFGDLRRPPKDLCDGIDAVIHLAGLSNDPTADFDPALNWELNVRATESLVEQAGSVCKFIFASSCSVYGSNPCYGLTEDAPTNPLSAYAESKLAAEECVLGCDRVGPVVLRQGTVCGWSPRMR
jgi:nucleoside-diphosphate-sugar epimerase